MTQPEAGGATVFPDLKVSVFPTKVRLIVSFLELLSYTQFV